MKKRTEWAGFLPELTLEENLVLAGKRKPAARAAIFRAAVYFLEQQGNDFLAKDLRHVIERRSKTKRKIMDDLVRALEEVKRRKHHEGDITNLPGHPVLVIEEPPFMGEEVD